MLYADFHADPIGLIEAIYKRYGLPFTATAATAMKTWYDDPANDGNRHGRFKYSLAHFRMTPDEVEAEMSAYRARFGIPYER